MFYQTKKSYTSKWISIFASVLLGLIYLLFGIAKAADINGFADILSRYGYHSFYILAPFIATFEIMLGFALLFFFESRRIAIVSSIFIIVSSIIFILAKVLVDIEDCGCLGYFYKMPIWLSFLRNIVILLLSLYLSNYPVIYKKNDKIRFFLCIGAGVLTIATSTKEMYETYHKLAYTTNYRTKNTFLSQYDSNDDKETLVFIFSPNCTSCKLVLPKINDLFKRHAYHNIIGLYPQEISMQHIKIFQHKYRPVFQIKPISSDSILQITHQFPLFVLLKNGEIQSIKRDMRD